MQASPYLRVHQGVLGHLRRARWEIKRTLREAERLVTPESSRVPAFVVGCGRSGTTLLARVLGRHPDLVSLNEPRERWVIVDPRTDDICLYTGAGTLDLGGGEVTDRARRAKYLISNPLGHPRHTRVVEKTPSNVFRVKWLRALYPGCPLINLVRDGRDVVSSIMKLVRENEHKVAPVSRRNQWWGLENCKRDLVMKRAVQTGLLPAVPEGLDGESLDVTAAALEWIMSIDAMTEFVANDKAQPLLEIRYEALVEHPERELGRILDFLGTRVRRAGDLCSVVDEGKPTRSPRNFNRFGDLMEPAVRQIFAARLTQLGYDAAA